MATVESYSGDSHKMDNVEIDDSEYHQDFTTASDWEVLTAGIEEILHSWKLTTPRPAVNFPKLAEGTWDKKSEVLTFGEIEFIMTWYFLNPESEVPESADDEEEAEKFYIFSELEFKEEDFAPIQFDKDQQAGLTLARMYGLRDFVVISPAKGVEIDTESKVKILLSSVTMAVNSCGCELPVFVQIREPWQQLYLGVCDTRGLATNFDMIHLQKGPQHCKYLNGLLDVFKGKIAAPISEPVRVSVQFTYSLEFMNNNEYRRRETIGVDDIGILHLGACLDPFRKMKLLATWQDLPEHMVIDSQNHSDFEPQQATSWSVKIKMFESPACLLSDCILEFLNLGSNHLTLSDLLGDVVSDSNNETVNALNRITESKVPSLTSVLRRATSSTRSDGRKRSRSSDGPLSEEFLIPILYFLFPDADNNAKRPFSKESELPPESGVLKSCGFDSLVWRLAIILAQCGHSLGGAKTVAHVWYEFVQEMRFRWEKSIKIPGLSSGFPDFRTSLLHQKLQLLNCCIERKLKRENNKDDRKVHDEQNPSTDSDEEFFDCRDENDKTKYSLWNEPVGRHAKYGSMKLIQTGDPLYIPITQEAVPKTEDQLEEDADVLVQLGDDAMGSELRARMMSASLLSDMESFKAANPNGIFEDFIRWYSPRDWIDDETKKDQWGQATGYLSSRMQIEDNTWLVMWESAKPVPARRQKRLFDDTREAEKVLHYLESRTLSQVVELLLPVLTHVSLYYLVDETCKNNYVELTTLPDMLRHLVKIAERVSRDSRSNTGRYEIIFQEMATVEAFIAKAKSLRRYFYEVNRDSSTEFINFFAGLLQKREMVVPDGPNGLLGDRINKMFHDVYKHFDVMSIDDSAHGDEVEKEASFLSPYPSPEKKEYLMRAMAKRPAQYSKLSPQYMRAVLKKKDFRLAGAFSQDTQFF